MASNRITINGTTVTVTGSASSVSIINGKVIVNGQVVQDGLSGIVEIKWDGPLASLQADAAVTCGDVHGNVRAASSVSAGDVGGSVNAGGSVNCGQVSGSVNAGGAVNCRR